MADFPSPFFEGQWSTPTTQATVSSAAEDVAAAAAAVVVQANAAAASAASATASAILSAASAAAAATYSTASGNYQVYNITASTYGAVPDARTTVTTATIALGSRVLTTAAPMFLVTDVGKLCSASRLDAAHSLSFTKQTITAFYSSTSVQLSGTPYSTGLPYGALSGESCRVSVGTDNSPAIQAALDAALAAGGGTVFIPPGRFGYGTALQIGSSTRLSGMGYGSELVGIGVGWKNPAGVDGLIINKDAVVHPQDAVTYSFSPTSRVDHDITFDNFRMTSDGTTVQGQKFIHLSMATRVKVLHVQFECTTMISMTAFSGPGCSDVLIFECRAVNVGGGGAAAWDFWKGWQDVKIIGTVVSTRPGDAVQVINMNAIGTSSDDTENGDDFAIIGNRLEMNGNSGGGGLLTGINADGLHSGSPTKRGVISGNTFIAASGVGNLGIHARGYGGLLHIVNNTFVGLGVSGNSVGGVIFTSIVSDTDTYALTGPAAVTNGSNVVTVTWANHKLSALDVTNGTFVYVPVDFGGITFSTVANSFYQVLSVVDANTFTFRAPSNATSTASGLGTGTWKFSSGHSYGNIVANNIIIDPQRSGYAPLEIGGVDTICSGNIVRVTSGSPQYASLVLVTSPFLAASNFSGTIVADNLGPSGTGVPSGYTGNGRVAWQTNSARPIIRDTDVGTGVTRFNSPLDFYTVTMATLQAGASYANDAAASAGGVAVGQFYRNGSILMIRVA